MHVSDVGEFGLIERVAGVLGPQRLVLGIGDDAAAWRPTAGRLVTATADSLVEGVHFDLRTTTWEDLGWKALAENVSDIAAMGCAPTYALIGLGLPGTTAVSDVEALYTGLRQCADEYGCQVVGGDTVRAPLVILHVTLLGESLAAAPDETPLLTRSAARPGDLLAVTGHLGGSAAGLRLLQAGGEVGEADRVLLHLHRRPRPRVRHARILVESGVRCALDVSDGLLADVGHICERSGVDAEVSLPRVPVDPAARARFGEEAVAMAVSGGEDYELVCAGSVAALAEASTRLEAAGESALIIIGSIMKVDGDRPRVRLVDADRREVGVGALGYQHWS